MKNYFGIDLKEKREALLKSDIAKPFIREIIKKADDVLEKEYYCLKFSDYMLFEEKGNRTIYERPYFERRNNLSHLSAAYFFTDDEKYIKPICDLIFIVSDEYSWCLPAHTKLSHKSPSALEIIETIDLFSAETARLFADISIILSDKLPPCVLERMEIEIRRRILKPMKKYDFHWKREINNWSAVCAGGVGIALLHFGNSKDKEEILPQIYFSMESFLSGYGEDGCCREGYSYWNYGFGYFLLFARAIKYYTGGKIDYFKRDIVKKIALYPQKVRLGNKNVVSFSDGTPVFTFSVALMSFLKEIYSDEFECPLLSHAAIRDNVYSIKELLWINPGYKADTPKKDTIYYPDAQWYIKKFKKYSFAAKGGHNGEMHNHNDIGSFMTVTENGEIPLADFGCGVYEKNTFDNRYRYTYFVNSSRGHSVPIINDDYQCFGEEYKAENVCCGDNFFSLDMEKAYKKDAVKKISRRFEFNENSVTLRDAFEFSENTKSIKERFVTLIKPETGKECVTIGNTKILYDNKRCSVNISSEVYRAHGDKENVTAYTVDFVPLKETENEFIFEIYPG